MTLKSKILKSLKKFDLNLSGKIVLTEAASGNYVVTPILAAIAGAKVYALFKESIYASFNEVKLQIKELADEFKVFDKITIITSYNDIDLSEIDILTNTGFNRPINKQLINKLSPKCVIPLMWEPWEYRSNELDLDACRERGIKVYGTNESDPRLRTMDYIGYIVLSLLLMEKQSPFSSNILVLGDEHFAPPIIRILEKNNYSASYSGDYNERIILNDFNVVVFAEHNNHGLLLGEKGLIKPSELSNNHLLIHIAGNVDVSKVKCKVIPDKPANFGYMSFTTDYIDSMAVIDLHTAGLIVAEGMSKAKENGLVGKMFKNFIESNYPGLAFENQKYW